MKTNAVIRTFICLLLSLTSYNFLFAQTSLWLSYKRFDIYNIYPEANGFCMTGMWGGIGIKKVDQTFNTLSTTLYKFKKDTFAFPPVTIASVLRKGIKLPTDSSYLLVGSVDQNPPPLSGSPYKASILKLSYSGDTIWYNIISNAEYLFDAVESTDGGVIAIGKYFFGKFNASDGHLEWNNSYYATNGYGCYPWACCRTKDSMTIITGNVFFNTIESDIFLLKIDDNGSVQWAKYYHSNVHEEGLSICATKDGGFLVAGDENVGHTSDMYVMKVDSLGSVIWSNKFDYDSTADVSLHVIETDENGFLVDGTISKFTGWGTTAYDSAFVLKGDSLGNMQWFRFLVNAYAGDLSKTSDNSYFNVVGDLIKLDSLGNFCNSIVDTISLVPYNLVVDTFSISTWAGFYSDPTIYIDTVNAPIDSIIDLCLYSGDVELKNDNSSIMVFPNPTNDYVIIQFTQLLQEQYLSIKIIDALGNEMLAKNISSQVELKLPTQNIANGIYFLQVITAEQKMFCKKILIMH